MRLLRRSLCLLLTLITAIGSALLIGRSQPDRNPLLVAGFDVCGNQLCFRKIVAGKTQWVQVEPLISLFANHFVDTNMIVLNSKHLTLSLYRRQGTSQSIAQSVVDYYILNIDPVAPAEMQTPHYLLADFMLLLGEPCATYYVLDKEIVRLIYPDFVITVALQLPSGRLRFDSAVQAFSSRLADNQCDMPANDRWLGFAAARRYTIS
ncbi:MAG: hypothetical protein KF726_28775 [Anaerolineae bacterium]|nr:hypothetical protein [Anaerolineae bacterium]